MMPSSLCKSDTCVDELNLLSTRLENGELLGIVGGVGPIASAEFLNTIYDCSVFSVEQSAPRVVLISEPTLPDRTCCLDQGDDQVLLEYLEIVLRKLKTLGVEKVVICCFTLHSVIPLLSQSLKRNIISLVDIALKETVAKQKLQLLLCSWGSRKRRIYENSYFWTQAKKFVVLPNSSDQDLIHWSIYDVLKVKGNPMKLMPLLLRLMDVYGVDSFLIGCSEFHIMSMALKDVEMQKQSCEFVDPLLTIANNNLCSS